MSNFPGLQAFNHEKSRDENPPPQGARRMGPLRFMIRATELGFCVTKPWGDMAPFDLALEHRGHFARVQIKCTIYHRGHSYKCHLDSNGIPYLRDQIDFFAAYVIPTNTWYILPLKATNHQPDILLTPHRPKSKYWKYQEAWHLLRP
jgi:hypothetical protein